MMLVLGSGIAGLTAALAAADQGAEVLLLTKNVISESNTRYAQGGVAAVLDQTERDDGDTVAAHLEDTIKAGAGLCDAANSEAILNDSASAIDFLRQHGCRFDLTADGSVDLTREGGHSFRRILHAKGDSTGAEVVRSLQQAVLTHERITVRENSFALDLLENNGRICGACMSVGVVSALPGPPF